MNQAFFVDFSKGRSTHAETAAEGPAAGGQARSKKACRAIGKKAEKVLDFPRVYGMIETGN